MKIPFGRFDKQKPTGDSSRERLNPTLYRRLVATFGSVLTAHDGEKFVARSSRDLTSDRTRLVFQQRGESYRVCCPFCSDTRHRLYVSYMYGQKDDSGRFMYFLAFCFNEECLVDYFHQVHFREMLDTIGTPLSAVRVRDGVEVAETTTFEMPGNCCLLSELEPGHDARAYVASRFLSVDRISRAWGVSYCLDYHSFFVRDRIVIPIRFNGRLAGWQSRYPGDLEWKGKDKRVLKYFTCPNMKRDRVICNWDMAKVFKTVVVTEGWFDIFALGPMAVCTLGVGLSSHQIRTLVAHAKKNDVSVVLAYDADVRRNPKIRDRYLRLIDQLHSSLPGQFLEVRMPNGFDPGSLDRDVSRGIIEHQAMAQGIPISWNKLEV